MNKNQKWINDKQYAKNLLKKIWICVLCLIPFMILITYLWAILKIPTWISIVLNVLLGGFVCLTVYLICDKIEQKKYEKSLMKTDEKDPFSD